MESLCVLSSTKTRVNIGFTHWRRSRGGTVTRRWPAHCWTVTRDVSQLSNRKQFMLTALPNICKHFYICTPSATWAQTLLCSNSLGWLAQHWKPGSGLTGCVPGGAGRGRNAHHCKGGEGLRSGRNLVFLECVCQRPLSHSEPQLVGLGSLTHLFNTDSDICTNLKTDHHPVVFNLGSAPPLGTRD